MSPIGGMGKSEPGAARASANAAPAQTPGSPPARKPARPRSGRQGHENGVESRQERQPRRVHRGRRVRPGPCRPDHRSATAPPSKSDSQSREQRRFEPTRPNQRSDEGRAQQRPSAAAAASPESRGIRTPPSIRQEESGGAHALGSTRSPEKNSRGPVNVERMEAVRSRRIARPGCRPVRGPDPQRSGRKRPTV